MYTDLYIKSQDPDLIDSIPCAARLGPRSGWPTIELEGEDPITIPGAGELGWFYAALRFADTPPPLPDGVEAADPSEVAAVVGVWA